LKPYRTTIGEVPLARGLREEEGWVDMRVQFLIDAGADINALSKQGFTPLDVAMGKSIVGQLPVPHESTVALLKKLGATEGPPRAARPPAPPPPQ